MAINARIDDRVVVLSGFGRLMNDPKHFDASQTVRALLDEGHRAFVFDLTGLPDLGSSALGLLTTLTRLIRHYDGDAVVAHASHRVGVTLDEMRMDAYWETFDTVEEAKVFLIASLRLQRTED
jgi:anti-sigma B factor antagonist